MTEKTAGSLSSSVELSDDKKDVTLAQALEEAIAAREATVQIKGEMLEELERFRAAVRKELKARKRKVDLHDVFLFGGLGTSAAGITVAFHWAYALMFVGCALIAISVIALFSRTIKA